MNCTINIIKIDNGYIVSRSIDCNDGRSARSALVYFESLHQASYHVDDLIASYEDDAREIPSRPEHEVPF